MRVSSGLMRVSSGFHRCDPVWLGLILVSLTALILTACKETQPVGNSNIGQPIAATFATALAELRQEPTVRVRLQAGVVQSLFYASGTLSVSAIENQAPALQFHSPVIVVRRDRQFLVRGAGSAWMAYTSDGLRIVPSTGSIQYRQAEYPGEMLCRDVSGDRLDVINRLPIEAYLPGVLAKELYPNWHINAYRAQAIAARSYAIAMLNRTKEKPYDLESTTASQAYAGLTDHAPSVQAVAQTRGQVLVWQDRVVTAYYSSCCGGQTQDARLAFSDAVDISPLRSRDAEVRDCCSASPNRSWTVTRDRRDLALRLTAWGKANRHPIAQLSSLGNIGVTARNAAGRPVQFAVVDASGRDFRLGPEQFRFACNTAANGLAALSDSAQLKSSLVEVQVQGNRVTFNGRGFGHGIGLCQWGAQGLASRGWDDRKILSYYYPGAAIKTAYGGF